MSNPVDMQQQPGPADAAVRSDAVLTDAGADAVRTDAESVPMEPVEPVAIVGLAVRVPGADDARQFWRNLMDRVESVTRFTREEQIARGAAPEHVDDPSWVNAAPYIAGHDEFDAGFFGMTPREAEITDPQHRLLLESCHRALEDAGYDPARYDGEIGVYAGSGANTYMWQNVMRNASVVASQTGGMGIAIGNQPSYLATGVSYRLDLRGPSLTVHTACSTSLVAMHMACEALRSGECDMALAGGVNIETPHGVGYVGVEGFTSPNGRCRPFDAGADGTVWGSGMGVVLLKRLSDAIADGDRIRAVVLGNAVNNDGAGKVGFSAPSVDGQISVLAQAVGMAGVDPRTITYVEAHGTGTALGDPIEVAALTAVYGAGTVDHGWCGIGSVKSNIGHLSQASGVVSVIKTVLAMEHGVIPPTVNYDAPNPAIDFGRTPFYVADTAVAWQTGQLPRRAGVSSFGVGGTNAHLVLQEAPRAAADGDGRPAHLLRVSARTPTALTTAVEQLAAHLADDGDLDLADVAHTLHAGRREHPHRAVVVARDAEDAAEALRDARRRQADTAGAVTPQVAFLFPGQGAQFAGMGAELYGSEPVFRAVVDECAGLLGPELDVKALLFGTGREAEELLRQTRCTQPALFTVELALARLLESYGVRPSATAGHSVGEYVAATLAGVFAPGDALRLVAERGRLMQSMPSGAMLAVQLDEAEVAARLPAGGDVTVATVNGPGACVVAGPAAAVEEFARGLKAAGIGCKALRTSHAFHSPMMDPVLAEFTALVAAVPRNAPRQRFVSNVTGTWITDAEATDPAYWARHLRQPVRFGDGVATLLGGGPVVLLECGPGRQLTGLARKMTPSGAPDPLRTLPGPGERLGETETLLGAVGALWLAGLPVGATAPAARRVPLPTTPFERKRYSVEPDPRPGAGETSAPAAVRVGPQPLDRWFAAPVWRQLPPDAAVPAGAGAGDWLVFGADGEVPEALRGAGARVVEVRAGAGFAAVDGGFTVRAGVREDYDALVAALGDDLPRRIVHAFAAGGKPAGADVAGVWAAQDEGFFSLLWLTQALGAAGSADGTRIDVVTSGTCDVAGGDLTRPEHATLAGVVRVLPREAPGLTVRLIDVEPGGACSRDALLAELLRTGPAEVALRGGRRWAQQYEQLTVESAEPGVIRDRGCYLITGGLGGIGITVAEDLAIRAQARLVLVTRSGLPPRTEWDAHLAAHGGADRIGRSVLAIRRMERAGAQVLVVAADVTDPDDMRRVRAAAQDAFGPLHGIVHAAGVPGGGMAEVRDRAAAEAVLAPKLAGTVALSLAFGDADLDFVALCSSITAVAGDFGQVDYCAANAFLDACARAGHGWRARVVSHNWGGWAEVGMAAEVAAPSALRSAHAAVTEPVDHPVVTGRSGAECHGLVSAATHWVLDQHRIDGVPVVPGTAHLETVRAAVAATSPAPGPQHAVELRDVAFQKPFAVSDVAEYQVVLSDGEFTVRSRAAGRTSVHVSGSAGWIAAGPAADLDVAAVTARCAPAVEDRGSGAADDGGPEAGGRTSMLTFGPRWDVLREHWIGDGEELALIAAARQETPAAPESWWLDPACLDVATAFGRSRGSGTYLPLGYGRVVVRESLPAVFYSHLRYRDDGAHNSGDAGGDGIVAADLTLCDTSGRVLVEVTDFVLRRVDEDAVSGGLAADSGQGAPAAHGQPADADGRFDDSPARMIRPVDGAEAFRRALSARLGPQVVISTLPVAELLERQLTSAELETGTDAEQDTAPDANAESAPGGVLDAGAAFTAPRPGLETSLADLWSSVLGVEKVGADEDFFALGGTSLVAIQLIAQIRKAEGVRLPMRVLFDAPTVSQLAARIEETRGGAAGADQGAGSAATSDTGSATTSAIPRLRR